MNDQENSSNLWEAARGGDDDESNYAISVLIVSANHANSFVFWEKLTNLLVASQQVNAANLADFIENCPYNHLNNKLRKRFDEMTGGKVVSFADFKKKKKK